MRIALVQIDTKPGDIKGNLEKICLWSRKAAEQNIDMVMFHESALADYVADAASVAQDVPGSDACQQIKMLSEELGIVISFGLTEKDGDKLFITQVFFGPNGYFHKYRKTNLHVPADPAKAAKRFRDEDTYFTRGSGPGLFEILGKKAACIICADGNSDEVLAAVKALHPEIVFFPNNRARPRPDEYWGGIAQKVNTPLLITNRVGESWGFSSLGGAAAYDHDGVLIAKANTEGREEFIIVEM